MMQRDQKKSCDMIIVFRRHSGLSGIVSFFKDEIQGRFPTSGNDIK